MSKLVIAVIVIIIIIIIVAVALMMPSLPAGIKEGDVIQCPGNAGIFKVEGGKKRWYSWNAYVAAGQPVPKVVSCDALNKVPNGANV